MGEPGLTGFCSFIQRGAGALGGVTCPFLPAEHGTPTCHLAPPETSSASFSLPYLPVVEFPPCYYG